MARTPSHFSSYAQPLSADGSAPDAVAIMGTIRPVGKGSGTARMLPRKNSAAGCLGPGPVGVDLAQFPGSGAFPAGAPVPGASCPPWTATRRPSKADIFFAPLSVTYRPVTPRCDGKRDGCSDDARDGLARREDAGRDPHPFGRGAGDGD